MWICVTEKWVQEKTSHLYIYIYIHLYWSMPKPWNCGKIKTSLFSVSLYEPSWCTVAVLWRDPLFIYYVTIESKYTNICVYLLWAALYLCILSCDYIKTPDNYQSPCKHAISLKILLRLLELVDLDERMDMECTLIEVCLEDDAEIPKQCLVIEAQCCLPVTVSNDSLSDWA